jgi:FixJ family two-component response regulator
VKNPHLVAIVDDDESFRAAIANLIRSLGHSVASFGSAEEFLKWDHLHDTGCLISDVQMPGMSGFELQNQLRTQGYRVPIIFVAADSDSKTRDQALASGALGFLNKPFNEKKLISGLGQALAKSKG